MRSRSTRQQIVYLCIGLVFIFSGCALFETKEERNAQELAFDGMEEYNNGNYRQAIEAFETLKDWYPFSRFAILAELKKADAHYKLEEYEEAVFAYEEFENLHPRNEAIPYVIYQIGMCSFEQIDTIDRNQAPARNALNAFRRLRSQFPNDAHSHRARDHIKTCLKSLAGHDLYVGRFYFKSKHYKAALARFKSILTYADVGIHREALQYIAACKEKLAGDAANAEADN